MSTKKEKNIWNVGQKCVNLQKIITLYFNPHLDMKTLVEQINAGFEAFAKDAAAQVESGNKAAGARARKVSLELEKLLKEFRKNSIAAAK